MTPRRGTRRGEALRRAHEAKARRDAERADRESRIETALADYYQATAESERIKDTARRKADTLLSAADDSAAESDAAARAAVRRLRDLLGGTTEVAHLCGLTVPAVRTLLAETAPEQEKDPSECGDGYPVAGM